MVRTPEPSVRGTSPSPIVCACSRESLGELSRGPSRRRKHAREELMGVDLDVSGEGPAWSEPSRIDADRNRECRFG